MTLLIHRGRALPLGLSCRGICGIQPHENATTIVNFSLHSRSARSVELQLHDRESGALLHQLPLDFLRNRTGEVWHIEIGNLDLPLRYSWLVNGRSLVDPRAQALQKISSSPDPDGTEGSHPTYHALFPLASRQWKHLRPERVAMQDLVVYEMHVKGFTAHPSSGVRSPGHYAGIIEKLPYLKSLGINAIELMPVHEFDPAACVFINPETGKGLHNYWGYDPVGLMAPATCYSSHDDPLLAVEEFREMVDACHGAGLEVILDVVLNHTAEGAAEGPSFNFRGLDEDLWYMQTPDGNLMDFTGCGNTFNCNHPVVREYILSCLRAWVVDMGVDGFRFDLAAVLGRDTNGKVLENAPVLEAISADPVLANTRLIAEAWDAAGLVQVGAFQTRNEDAAVRPAGDWAEWNGSFRDCMRRLVRGEKNMVASVASRVAGSADMFQASGRSPASSLNFITCHDGFTLVDLVSYTSKRNLANGEDNCDGSNDNHSQNCGAEGPSTDSAVLQCRGQQQRNLLSLLFLSQGVPMLLAGDEFGRSQQGNNNAWCQDNALSWLDWSLLETNAELHSFVKAMIAFRRAHPQLRRGAFFGGGEHSGIKWHGVEPFKPDFASDSHALAWQLIAREGSRQADAKHSQREDRDIYVAFNFWEQGLDFELPDPPEGRHWKQILDTTSTDPIASLNTMKPSCSTRLRVASMSLVVLVAEK